MVEAVKIEKKEATNREPRFFQRAKEKLAEKAKRHVSLAKERLEQMRGLRKQ